MNLLYPPPASSKKQKHWFNPKFTGTEEEYEKCFEESTTVYVANFHPAVTEQQLHEIFSKCGSVKSVVLGLNKFSQVPCGYAFVEYYNREDAEDATKYLNEYSFYNHTMHVGIDSGNPVAEGRHLGKTPKVLLQKLKAKASRSRGRWRGSGRHSSSYDSRSAHPYGRRDRRDYSMRTSGSGELDTPRQQDTSAQSTNDPAQRSHRAHYRHPSDSGSDE